jgi:hypothetical protein
VERRTRYFAPPHRRARAGTFRAAIVAKRIARDAFLANGDAFSAGDGAFSASDDAKRDSDDA